MLQKKIIFDTWDNYFVKVKNVDGGKDTLIEVQIYLDLHPF